MRSTHAPILPLPQTVISRLRSTLTITTLPSVLSELLQNSLDASSTAISITLNLPRCSFTITDNGTGIPAPHLVSLGTLYATSRFPPSPTQFGSRGEALAAIAQHALLSVTTRANGYRSTNMVRWAYGKRVFDGPAPEHLVMEQQGTTVRVDGLWGDLPVRRKAWEAGDREKEMEAAVRTVVELLMSGRAVGVGVVVRDEKGERKLVVKPNGDGGGEKWDLRVLKMAGVAEADGWEPVKAKQRGVGIEGWIRRKGSVGKGCQFLYVNGFPLSSGNTILHAEVNRIFANSTFGVLEEVEGDRRDVMRRTVKKGPETKGMYVLRIECRAHGPGIIGGEGGTEGKAGVEGENLKHVLELLQKLVFEFLKAHHFRPFASPASEPSSKNDTATVPELFEKAAPRPSTSSESKISETPQSLDLEERRADLEEYSRIKAARKDSAEITGRTSTGTLRNLALRPSNRTITSFTRSSKSASPGPGTKPSDTTINWLNPNSGKVHQIYPNTGNVKRPSLQHRPSSSSSTSRLSLSVPNKRLRTTASSCCDSTSTSPSAAEPGQFVKHLLETWQNPIFPLNPAPIPSVSTTSSLPIIPETLPFTAATASRLGRISKSGLQHATVIAQVDNKYILIRTPSPASMLVIIDQHAASERIRTETLFEALCAPGAPTKRMLQKPVTKEIAAKDLIKIEKRRKECERWGVEFEVDKYQGRITVTALPAVAAERTDIDPIEGILLKYAVDLDEGGTLPPSFTSTADSEGVEWYQQLATVPRPLKDLVNSRACRGAVMFGDVLEMEECEELVRRLAESIWPFMCAHGRPSLRPLVEMEEVGRMQEAGNRVIKQEGFRKAWGKMMEREKRRGEDDGMSE